MSADVMLRYLASIIINELDQNTVRKLVKQTSDTQKLNLLTKENNNAPSIRAIPEN